jgi:hypothetical protein
MTSKAVQELGRKGGSAKSEAKTKAARANAAKPRGKLVTVIAYIGTDSDGKRRFGATVEKGLLNSEQQFNSVCSEEKCWEWGDIETVVCTKRLIL